jgi:histidinol-phosphate phosphatase family protein
VSAAGFDVVIPTVGRASLTRLLDALDAILPDGVPVIVVDDRRDPTTTLMPRGRRWASLALDTVRGRAAGPAAARNVGWRRGRAAWTVFLDDDVAPTATWGSRLEADLANAPSHTAAVQGRIEVPLPVGRRPTDWERNVAGLAGARWATADMAIRRRALEIIDGFDERFPRAYREDADLGLRLLDAGYYHAWGDRVTLHPVPPAPWWISVAKQAGNADDALMRRLHGRDWRARAGAPAGRRPRHLVVTGLGVVSIAAGIAGLLPAAAAAGAGWVTGTAELAWARVAPGPRTAKEIAGMVATSVVLPAAATFHWLRGIRHSLRSPAKQRPLRPAAVLFDRDGTLVRDVPYNRSRSRVEPVAGARRALDRLRAAGVPVGVVTNQSGIGRQLVTADAVADVNRRVEELLGPMSTWAVCPHAPEDDCACRKPAPGLVLRAARVLGISASRCAVVGDIGSDVDAACAAGARPILVPTSVTRPEEIAAAPEVAVDLGAAVDLLLGAES